MTNTNKHAPAEWLHIIDTPNGGNVYVVETQNTIEYMVCDENGRTRKFSEDGFGNATRALYEGLQWYYDNEE